MRKNCEVYASENGALGGTTVVVVRSYKTWTETPESFAYS